MKVNKKDGLLQTNLITQIALVVKDIEKTSKLYAKLFGVDPPKISETPGQKETLSEYRGKPTDARAKLAFFRFKNIKLELIEPIGSPSTWQEHLDTHGEGVHHIAFNVKDTMDKVEKLKELGIEVQQKGNFSGGHYVYMDAQDTLHLTLELLGRSVKKNIKKEILL